MRRRGDCPLYPLSLFHSLYPSSRTVVPLPPPNILSPHRRPLLFHLTHVSTHVHFILYPLLRMLWVHEIVSLLPQDARSSISFLPTYEEEIGRGVLAISGPATLLGVTSLQFNNATSKFTWTTWFSRTSNSLLLITIFLIFKGRNHIRRPNIESFLEFF